MKVKFFVAVALLCLAAAAVRLSSQTLSSQMAVDMTGVKPALKFQASLEGFFTSINGKLDLRASEVDYEPGGSVGDHYHYGPGIRRVLSGELVIVDAETGKEQVFRAGDYFWESGDRSLRAYNRSKEPAKLLIVELVPANWKGSAMVPLARRAEVVENGTRLKDQVCR